MLRDRFFEALVEHISLEAPGFTVQTIKAEGFASLTMLQKKEA
ncbi:hypothetical protein SAMN05444372_10711 [Flavobacterium micromati]|uniref:Uncharacterized protein n=1 Tax=Flavobacterium micromati TaxID=229205 RepID=A0A1M5KM27_9FLAO|nr:hypothetical protein SAMN05444372_10711 [Flavobacterium micromati]